MTDTPDPTDERPRAASPDNARWVLFLLAFIAIAVGVLAAWRFRVSEAHITEALARIEASGPELDVEGCIDATLAWRESCSAMKSLCDSSVDRMLQACLAGRDRRNHCEALDGAAGDAHYGFTKCRERGLSKGDRQLWKPCGDAYKTLDQYCRHVTSRPTEAAP